MRKQRVRAAEPPPLPASAKTLKCAEHVRAWPPGPAPSETWARSQFPSQRKHRIQTDGPPDRRSTAPKRHDHGDHQYHRQKHRLNRNFGIEDGVPNLMRKHRDRKSTRLNSSHLVISYAVFCLKKK